MDVVVVGAGPAGASAATTLARAGRQVMLIDKARFPRAKACGDGLTSGALRELERLGLDPSTVPSWTPVRDLVLRGPAGRSTTFPLPEGPGWHAAVARRSELDEALVALSRSAGAQVVEGTAVRGLRTATDRVLLELDDDRTVRCRYVVAADGAWSPTRRLLGVEAPRCRGEWHAFRQYVRNVAPEASRSLFVSFEPDMLPGYLWSFPLADSTVNLGFGIRRGSGWDIGAMAHLWPELLRRPHVRELLGPHAEPEGRHSAWPIPARVGRVPLALARVLFAGDAAAVTDPLTGEGIGQALATGRWAAEALLSAGPADVAAATAGYDRTVRRALVADDAMARTLGRAISHRRGARIAIALAGSSTWTRANFARWLFEDYPRAVLLTPRRWSSGMFTPPGSFRT